LPRNESVHGANLCDKQASSLLLSLERDWFLRFLNWFLKTRIAAQCVRASSQGKQDRWIIRYRVIQRPYYFANILWGL